MKNVQTLHRIALASMFAAGLVSVGVAAGAQGTAQASASAAALTASNANNVALATMAKRIDRAAEIERENAEARRIAFRHLGTSL